MKKTLCRYFICIFLMQLMFTAIFVSDIIIKSHFLNVISIYGSAILMLFISYFFFRIVKNICQRSQKIAQKKSLEIQKKIQLQKIKEIAEREQEIMSAQKQMQEKLKEVYIHLKEKDNLAAQKLFKELSIETRHIQYRTYCSDYMIDGILNSKYQLATESGIQTEYKIMLPDSYSFSSKELCCVLFNLLDNGIESCQKSDFPNRFLHLDISPKSDFLIIRMKNTKSSRETFNGQTSKDDNFTHGFGLSVIEEIAKNNDGFCQWTDTGDTFESSVMLRFRNFSLNKE